MTTKQLFEELNKEIQTNIINHAKALNNGLKNNNQTIENNYLKSREGKEEERLEKYKKRIKGINDIVDSLQSKSLKLNKNDKNNFGSFKEIIFRLNSKEQNKIYNRLLKNGYTNEEIDDLKKFPIYIKYIKNVYLILTNSKSYDNINNQIIDEIKKLFTKINIFLEVFASVKTDKLSNY